MIADLENNYLKISHASNAGKGESNEELSESGV